MRNITKIFTLVLSLILLFAVSCSNDDKTGVKNNPPENDTEITDGETGSSGSGTGGSGTETGGGSGTGGTGTGGSEEGGGGTVTPPSETETIEEIEAKDFPPELLGKYRDEKVFKESGHGAGGDTEVSIITVEGIQKTQIKGVWFWLKDDGTKSGQTQTIYIETWKQTKKGGNPIKLEGEYVKGGEKYTIIYDYASETLSGTYTAGEFKLLFNGKKIS